MENFYNRKNQLQKYVEENAFFNSGALAKKSPFIFAYNPEDELKARVLADDFGKQLESKGHKPLHINLYELVIKILQDEIPDIMERYEKLEKKSGFDYVCNTTIHGKMDGGILPQKIKELSEGYDLIYITHIGTAYPYVRAHMLLNNLIDIIPANIKPIVLFYPGKYVITGVHPSMDLFGKLHEANFYRAFSLC